MSHAQQYLNDVVQLAKAVDSEAIEAMVQALVELREREGRLFLLGVGGSAANCSHAVNDFRKLGGIEAYSPSDNVAELTARINDEGWESVFANWLKVSRANAADMVFVLSVGGGDLQRNISPNIVHALDYATAQGMTILGIVGRDGGYVNSVGDIVVVIPTVHSERVTPHTESFQSVILHCLISHPALLLHTNKWEGLQRGDSKSGKRNANLMATKSA